MNALTSAFRHTACAARHWSTDDSAATGAALAFYCAFSLAPLLVILLTIAGWVVGATEAQGYLGLQLSALFGHATARILLDAIQTSQETQGLVATLVSVVTLLIGATTVLAALESALGRIWGDDRRSRAGVSGWIRRRVLSFGFVLTLGFLLLVSLAVSVALSSLRDWLADRHATLIDVVATLDFVMSLGLIATLFCLIYRYMPARRLPWKVVFTGGVITAILFNIGRWMVSLYLAHSTQPTAFGAAASFAALLLWFYYTAQIFLFGAEITACLGGLRAPASDQPAGNILSAARAGFARW